MKLEELKGLIGRSDNITITNKGIGPLSLLGVGFVILKLMKYITWSWWWVLAPFWIPAVIGLLIFIAVFVFIGIMLRKAPEVVTEMPKREEPVTEEPIKEKEEAPKQETVKAKKPTTKKKSNGETKTKKVKTENV